MTSVFVTGATGFLGSYVADVLLRETDVRLLILTRAKDRAEFEKKMWDALQLHMSAREFHGYLPRLEFLRGDLTAPDLGLSKEDRARAVTQAESVLHIAASLNRKSEKECLNHNLRGTLSVIKLAREIHTDHGLRRFSHVSTVAVAGQRDAEVVTEDAAIDWKRNDYDPYGRTKKFCEHMVRELLPDVQKTFFRPSMVIGDSRFAETTQFDMIRAVCVLADLPVVPFSGDVREDIVNADWVGRAIATIHMKPQPKWEIYHLSAGTSSASAKAISESIHAGTNRRRPVWSPRLEQPFGAVMNGLAGRKRRDTLTMVGSLFKVFLPYITYDTVFDNARAVEETGIAPVPFTQYGQAVYEFCKRTNFSYPYLPMPAREAAE
jgi:nucleoside-diphosphate-sugar epimerase